MKLLITGGNGFLGYHLIAEALKAGHEVTSLSRTPFPKNSIHFSRISYIKGDLQEIKKISLEKFSFDVMIDCVGAIKPSQLQALNLTATAGAITLCQTYGIQKIVYLSASGGYPTYIKMKKMAEQLVRKSELNYLIVRPGLLYGKERQGSIFQAKLLTLLLCLPILKHYIAEIRPINVQQVAKKIIETISLYPEQTLISLDELEKSGNHK